MFIVTDYAALKCHLHKAFVAFKAAVLGGISSDHVLKNSVLRYAP